MHLKEVQKTGKNGMSRRKKQKSIFKLAENCFSAWYVKNRKGATRDSMVKFIAACNARSGKRAKNNDR